LTQLRGRPECDEVEDLRRIVLTVVLRFGGCEPKYVFARQRSNQLADQRIAGDLHLERDEMAFFLHVLAVPLGKET
jgi:hypothetical protein